MKNIKINSRLWIGLALLLLGFALNAMAESEVKPSILHPKGLLWKIETPTKPASFVFGTMHVSDPAVTRLPAPVEQAFMQADHFVMEVLMTFEAIGTVSSASFFSDGRTLKGVMGDEPYQRLTQLLNKHIFIAENVMNNMKPWAVLSLLMIPADQQLASVPALDMQLYQRAVKRKLPVSGLESAQEQIDIFDTMSLSDQLWMLNRAMADIDESGALFSQMLNAYVARDLAKLVKIQSDLNDADSEIDDKFMYRLVDVRNQRMAKRMLPVLKQGNAFIAIGALHLPGRGGVLDLLEAQGYRVTAIY